MVVLVTLSLAQGVVGFDALSQGPGSDHFPLGVRGFVPANDPELRTPNGCLEPFPLSAVYGCSRCREVPGPEPGLQVLSFDGVSFFH